MTFYNDILIRFGHQVSTTLKGISKSYTQLATQRNRRIFLLRCKHLGVYPTFLGLNVNHMNFAGTCLENRFNDIILKTKLSLLNLSITQATKNINTINKNQQDQINIIKRSLPNDIVNQFLYLENKKYEKLYNKIKRKHINKLTKLTTKNNKTNNSHKLNLDWIDNISDTIIPSDVAEILSYGPNFSLEITNEYELPVIEYISSIETVINNKSDDEKNIIRSEITNVITNHKTKIKHKNIKTNNFQKNIKQKLGYAKKFIKDNPQIIVLKPDKSNKTVVMNKIDYNNKIENLLNDTNTYKKLKSDPTNIFEKKNNAFVKKILNNKEISTIDAKKLTIHNSIPPKIYGLPKIHKNDIPLRPIVSCIQSPFYNLSKYLSNCLSNITRKNEYYIKDSFSFKDFIDTLVIPDNYKLLSLDVVSLYTNIPNILVQKILSEKWNLIKDHTTMSKTNFIEAVTLTLSNNYFQYETSFYQQIDGCAMGSPISSTIAQLVMEYLEESVIEGSNLEFLFFKRYVDDCLMAVPENQTIKVLDLFNSFNEKLQFTIEIEDNNNINFLDMTLTRNHKTHKIVTQWYTKPTWSGRYLNYMSCHPKKQKLSVIVGLVDRALYLTSPALRPQSLNKVKDTLTKNNFKIKDIDRIIKQRTFKMYNKLQIKHKNLTEAEDRFVALPYTSGLSEKIAYILRKHGVRTCHKSQNKLNSMFTPLKSKTPTVKQSNVVYSIPCSCSKTYIGMTSQLLKNRINGHKYQSGASTALHKHERETSHTFCYNNTKILNKDKNIHKLAIKEMIEIKRDKNSINDRSDVGKLGQIYNSIIL